MKIILPILLLAAFCGLRTLSAADYQSVDPNWMPARLYFNGGALRPRVMDLITDPTAPTGQAGYAKAGVKEGGGLADSYTYENVPGRYRTTFYFKVADNTGDAAFACYYVHGTVKSDPRSDPNGEIHLKPKDFKQVGVYQEFTYDWEFYEQGYMVVAGTSYGKHDFWWGGFTTQLIEPFTDSVLLEKWKTPLPPNPNNPPFPPKGLTVPPVIPSGDLPRDGLRVHVVEGMFYDRFGLEEAIRKTAGATLTESETLSGGQVPDIAPKFPTTEELFKHNVLVLANVDIRRLGVLRRYVIREFVNRGGGLLVLGGPWTYGRCAMKGTWVEEMLPIRTGGVSDFVELPPDAGLVWSADAPAALRQIPLTGNPTLRWMHQAELLPEGRVFLTAGTKPVLVARQAGRGRVAAFLGTPLGEAAPGRQGFWESPAWPPATAAILQWLAGGGHDTP